MTATSKWIKGLIWVLGSLILSTIIAMFANGGHPTGADWQMLLSAIVTGIGGYIAKPPQLDQNPWGSINWKDFWSGLKVTAGSALAPVILFFIKSQFKSTTDWIVLIGIIVSYFGVYLLKALFTNSNGQVSMLKP